MTNIDLKRVDDVQYHLDKQQYIANKDLSTSLFLSLKMKKPIHSLKYLDGLRNVLSFFNHSKSTKALA